MLYSYKNNILCILSYFCHLYNKTWWVCMCISFIMIESIQRTHIPMWWCSLFLLSRLWNWISILQRSFLRRLLHHLTSECYWNILQILGNTLFKTWFYFVDEHFMQNPIHWNWTIYISGFRTKGIIFYQIIYILQNCYNYKQQIQV